MGVASPIGERIRAHFRGLGLQSLPVPEWGADGVPLLVHWRPVTLAERGAALEVSKRPLSFYAALVCAKALDAEGVRIFNDHDRHLLQNEASGDVVMRVGEAMLAVTEPKPLGE